MRQGRGTVWAAALLAPAVYLGVDPGGWYPFGPVKWLAATVLVAVATGALLAERPLRVERWSAAAWAGLLAALTLGAAVGLDPRYAWLGTPERHLGLVTWVLFAASFVVGQHLTDGSTLPRPLLGGLAVAAVGTGLVATLEAVGWDPGPIGLGGARLTGTFGTAAFLGTAAALLIPVTAGFAADRILPPAGRVAAGVAVPLLVVALLGSGTRAAWVGVAAAGAVVAGGRRTALRARLRGRAGAVMLAVLLAVGIGAAVVAWSPVGGRVASVADRDAPGGAGRVDEWRVATRVVARHPVTGVGPEGYRIAFAEGADRRYERAHGRDPLPDRAHSAPLDVAAAGGVGAVVGWLALLGVVGRSTLRAVRSDRAWVAGLGAGMVAHGTATLFLFPTVELDLVAWLLAGVVVAADPVPRRTRPRAVPRVVPVAVAFLAVVVAVTGAVGVVADRRAQRATDALQAGHPVAAVTAAEGAVDLQPGTVRYWLLVAEAKVAAQEGYGAALAAVDRALAVSPGDPIALVARARYRVARAGATVVPAHAAAARAAVDALLARDPVRADAWLLAGDLAAIEGDAPEATRAWRRAEDLAPRSTAPPLRLARLALLLGRTGIARAAVARALAIDPADPAARTLQRMLAER